MDGGVGVTRLHLDFETRSEVDLTKVGAWHYALHPSTEILCMTFGPDPKSLTTVGGFGFDWSTMADPFGPDDEIVAHNVPFEYACLNLILHRRYGWKPHWNPKNWNCTLSRALMCGLPAGLDPLSRVLEFKTPKDLEGRRVMQQLCKPLGRDALGDPIFDNSPAKMERLKAYNRTDVLVEIEADAWLPPIPEIERPVFELDLVMNRRGIQIDLEMARKAAAMGDEVETDLNARLRVLTGGAVDRHTQRASLLQYLKSQGVEIPIKHKDGEEKETMDRVARIEVLARPDLPAVARDVVNIRHEASKASSVAKYAKALEMACPDGRVRGNLQYHGAHTGRWAGRLLQAQNFPKGYGGKGGPEKQAEAVALIRAGDTPGLVKRYGTGAMGALSDALRGMIVAAPGKVLVSADFSAIEARVLFWLAGDEGGLATYRRGESPYVDMANFIYRRSDCSKEGTPKEYDIGKRVILGCGYGLGAAKFRANVYEETAKSTGTPVLLDEDLAERAVSAYRDLHAPVVRLWKETEGAMIAAVKNPGKVYQCAGGKVLWGMSKDRRFLAAKLPSGRFLRYYKPSVRVGETPWGQMKEEVVFWGEHPKTGQWEQLKTYGGMAVENIDQATARDLMANGMINVRDLGIVDLLLTVHDEELGEATDPGTPGGRAELLVKFSAAMCKLPSWAAGCPVTVEGWCGPRYRK